MKNPEFGVLKKLDRVMGNSQFIDAYLLVLLTLCLTHHLIIVLCVSITVSITFWIK